MKSYFFLLICLLFYNIILYINTIAIIILLQQIDLYYEELYLYCYICNI